jgi:hypothetical protein
MVIVLFLTLGAVIWYAYEAHRQANLTIQIDDASRRQAESSVSMATEMERSRHDELRPVLDIQGIPQDDFGTGLDALREALSERMNDHHVWFVLRNIG